MIAIFERGMVFRCVGGWMVGLGNGVCVGMLESFFGVRYYLSTVSIKG